jgi:hypothetical protein
MSQSNRERIDSERKKLPARLKIEQRRLTQGSSNGGAPVRRLVIPLLALVLVSLLMIAMSPGVANARSIRESSGYTGKHTHVTWAGPDVGVVAWDADASFVSWTSCGSSRAGVTVDAAWNSESLHNGAELDILFSTQRSDGRHFELGNVFKITKAQPWPGHPAFGGQFRASVYTPRGTYLKYATVTSWIVNGGVAYPPAASNTVRLHQWTKSC